jgi:sugar fermentation stimulation protein A
MRLDAPLIEGKFIKRYKRFFVDVELEDGSIVTAHCPNTGSLKGCKVEGAQYSWQAIQIGRTWVNVDTGLPNHTVRDAVERDLVPELTGYAEVKPEQKYGTGSRIDLLLSGNGKPDCYVEIKNTTLADDKLALFPDAVTSRGLKHLGELEEVVRQGHRAVQFFFISRSDVQRFAPADDIDPAYCAGLRQAAANGVEVLAYSVKVTKRQIQLNERLEVVLDPALA